MTLQHLPAERRVEFKVKTASFFFSLHHIIQVLPEPTAFLLKERNAKRSHHRFNLIQAVKYEDTTLQL